MLLAFDTASPTVTVALLDGDDVRAEAVSTEAMRHGEQLAPLIEETLALAGVGRGDITGIAVGVGPGPFTGLRVGLVTARTLGLVLDVPVTGVCSLDALALQAVEAGDVGEPFVVATDARRKEVYLAEYDAAGDRLGAPSVARPGTVATERPVVGEGAVLYPDAFPHRVGPVRPAAAWLGLGMLRGRAERLPPEPLYLRRPDAEIPGAPKPVS
ncbi:tRNA (adenosine(37)-N6)-threonylcarbamoyltransferase complex dimerization subunit type 1 TsaB [Nocardioides sp. GXZ039]|uniref:tRNA (adenosine(37)-N6)-threonylcarbamoyltransferase complex dimerization subunit type 1 TsaB n=1 Tax=Nocardioides sp. GXZ039 TaxID=3136018 RepID=UPI0030F3FACD